MNLLLSVLHVLFINMHHLLDLFIPSYYASQAASLLNPVQLLTSDSVTGHIDDEGQHADAETGATIHFLLDDVHIDTSPLSHDLNASLPSTPHQYSPELIVEPTIEQLDREDGDSGRGTTIASCLSLPINDHTDISLPRRARPSTPPEPIFKEKVESLWTIYIEHLCKEWLILLSITTTILLGSPPLLQLPGTNGDPVVRGFVYLFLFRFLAVVPSTLALLYYFLKTQWRSYACYEKAEYYRQSHFHMPYIILALPAISFCWGLIFIVLALFLSLWRWGLTSNAPPMASTSVAFRIIITAMSLADVAWISWLIANLKAFEAKIERRSLAVQP